MVDPFALNDLLAKHGQEHLLAELATLGAEQRERYLAQLASIDWAELSHAAAPLPAGEVGASRVITRSERQARAATLRAAGEAAYGAGRAAVLMVAGGQGTRLGSSAPKGCFPIAPHSGKSIFQLQAEKVLSLSRRFGRQVPFLIMTSPMTDADTREFFQANGWFGLDQAQLRFFSQGTVPSIDQQGRALLRVPGMLLENPDGHGGCFTALVTSGNLARLHADGIEQIIYIQVDNILAPVDDPELLGLASLEGAEVITKVLPKAHPDEKVGHLVRVAGSDRIVEYTELTPAQTRLTSANGEPLYRWGSPAMLSWGVAFLARLAARGYQIPLHRSAKPLKAWLGGAAQDITGWKSERFIFDLIPEARTSLGLEIDRDSEFAPVKNPSLSDGKPMNDSPATAVALASRLYASWLAAAGVTIALPAEARIEISPLYAATREQFLARWDRRLERLDGDYYLEA